MEAIRTWYLDEDGQPTETEHGDVRVRLYYDEADRTMADASGDAAPLIVHIDPHFGHVYQKVEAGEQYSGDIYRWEVERRRTGRKVYDDGDETEFDEWDPEDSCGGFIGRDYAETEALSALGYEPGPEDNAGR